MTTKYLAVGGISLALAWSVFFKAGVWPVDWHVTLLILGCLCSLGLFKTRLSYLLFLVPAYVVLQLVPLPAKALAVLSPARAHLVQQFTSVFPGYETAPLSVNPPTTVLLLFSVLGYLATFLLVRELAGRFSNKPWTLTIPLLIIGAFEATLGLFQAFTGPSAAIATGTYTNRDHFAGLLEMILPLALLYGISLFRRQSGSVLKMCALLLVATLLALAIAYSLSRMGFLVMLAVSLIVIALALRSKWRWPYVGLIGVAVVAAVLFFSPGQLVDRFVNIPVGDQTAGEIRLGIWHDTLRLIAEYPLLGCGLGAFEPVYLKHQTVAANYSVAFAHNDYLQALAELGIIGFAILAAVLTAVVTPIFRRAWQMGQDDRRYLLIACCGAWVAILLHSFVDFNMYIPANAMTLAWITGIGSAQVSA